MIRIGLCRGQCQKKPVKNIQFLKIITSAEISEMVAGLAANVAQHLEEHWIKN